MPRSSLHSDENKILVAFLVATRKSLGLTQVELADRLNKNQQFVSRIESGERRIDLLEFIAIARAMDQRPADLLKRLLRKLPKTFDLK